MKDLNELVNLYAGALRRDGALPPPVDDLGAGLRAAAAVRLAPKWTAYVEYWAAYDASMHGDPGALRAAAEHLAEFRRRHPEESFAATRRILLLADLLRQCGDFGDALAEVDAVLCDTDAIANPAMHANALGLRSEILRETGRLEEAAAASIAAVALALASGDAREIESELLREQMVWLATKRFAMAIETIDERLRVVGGADRWLRAALLVLRGYAESGLADQSGDDSAKVATAMRTLDMAWPDCEGQLRVRAALKRLHLALRARDVAAAEWLIRDCEASLGDALHATPPSRNVSEYLGLHTRFLLLRNSSAAELRAWLPQQQRAQAGLEHEWRSQPPSRGGIGFLHLDDRRELLGAGIALELALAAAEGRDDGPERAAQILLDVQANVSLARVRGARTCSVATVQHELLRDDHAILAYLPTRRVTYAFLIERGAVTCHLLPGNPGDSAAVGAFSSGLARPPGIEGEVRSHVVASLAGSGRRVSELLLPAPLLDRVRSLAALTVVGADMLNGVPFEALPLDDGRLLGEVVAIDSTGSMPLVVTIARCATPVRREQSSLLLLGCTQPDAAHASHYGVASFGFPTEVLRDAAKAFGRHDEVFDGAVTRDAVVQRTSAVHDVVHLVAHRVSSCGGEQSGLLVGDGALWRSDLDRMDARGLVVVSACGAGEGPVRVGEGEGFASFVGAFLWSGAAAVIASRNDLLALDHLRTMAICHRHLAAGDSPARAMQRARSAMAATPDSDLLARSHRAMVQVFGAGQVPLIRR